MKIVVDGLDGEGKSTFIKNLDYNYVHFPLYNKRYTVDEYIDEMIFQSLLGCFKSPAPCPTT